MLEIFLYIPKRTKLINRKYSYGLPWNERPKITYCSIWVLIIDNAIGQFVSENSKCVLERFCFAKRVEFNTEHYKQALIKANKSIKQLKRKGARRFFNERESS